MIHSLVKLQATFHNDLIKEAEQLTMLIVLASSSLPGPDPTAQIENDIAKIQGLVKKSFAADGNLNSYLDGNKQPTKDTVYNVLVSQLKGMTKKYPLGALKLMCLQGFLNFVDELLMNIYRNKAPAVTPTSQHAKRNMDWLKDYLLQATGIDWPPNIILKRIKANVDKDSDDFARYDLIRKIAETNPELTAHEIIAIFREKYPDLSHMSVSQPKVVGMIQDIKAQRRLRIFDDIEAVLKTKRPLVAGLSSQTGRGSIGTLSRQNAIIESALELKQKGYRIEYPTLRNLLNSELQIAPNKFAGPKWHAAYEEWINKKPEQGSISPSPPPEQE